MTLFQSPKTQKDLKATRAWSGTVSIRDCKGPMRWPCTVHRLSSLRSWRRLDKTKISNFSLFKSSRQFRVESYIVGGELPSRCQARRQCVAGRAAALDDDSAIVDGRCNASQGRNYCGTAPDSFKVLPIRPTLFTSRAFTSTFPLLFSSLLLDK